MGERGLHICSYEYIMYEFIIHYGRRLCRVSALGTPTPPSVTTHPCSVSNPSKPIGFLTGMKLGFVIWNLIRRRVDTASFLHRENLPNGHRQKAQGSVYRCCIVTINITVSVLINFVFFGFFFFCFFHYPFRGCMGVFMFVCV